MNVAFVPKNVGPLTGLLTVSDQFRSQTVTMNGIGVAPPGVSLAPFSTINFPASGIGITSAAQTVTLTNNGGASLLVQSIAVTGDFAIVPGSTTCGGSVPVSTACTMQIAFTPTAGGIRSGTLTVMDNAGNSPQTLALTGNGVDFALNSNGSTSLTIASGQNAVYPLLLSSATNVSGTASFACSGAPVNSICTVTPSNVALGNSTTISVTVLTGVASTALLSHPPRNSSGRLWLAALLPMSLLAFWRTRRRSLIGIAVLSCLIVVTGCGAGRAIPLDSGSGSGPTSPVTPAGTYTIAASASSAGLTRTVNLTLIVQ
jgi:hypothetical protein